MGRGSDGPVLAETKTKRRHVVDIDRDTNAALADHRGRIGASVIGEDRFVFSDDQGTTAWKPNRVTKAFGRHRRAVGLRPFRLHDLRHSWLPRCSKPGSRSWSSPAGSTTAGSTTLDRYAYAVPGSDATAATTLRATIDNGR